MLRRRAHDAQTSKKVDVAKTTVTCDMVRFTANKGIPSFNLLQEFERFVLKESRVVLLFLCTMTTYTAKYRNSLLAARDGVLCSVAALAGLHTA